MISFNSVLIVREHDFPSFEWIPLGWASKPSPRLSIAIACGPASVSLIPLTVWSTRFSVLISFNSVLIVREHDFPSFEWIPDPAACEGSMLLKRAKAPFGNNSLFLSGA